MRGPRVAVILDWDGVVIDSASAHARSWERLAARERRALPEGHFRRGFGMKNERIIRDLLGWTADPDEIARLGLLKEVHYRDILREEGVVALAGVHEFLTRVFAARIPVAIGSSTPLLNIETVLGLLRWRKRFPYLVTAEDVTRGKPDPEVFLKAAERMGLEPSSCIVCEDALVGIAAARAAGMGVVAVPTSHTPEELDAAGADRVVMRLDDLGVPDLLHLLGARRR